MASDETIEDISGINFLMPIMNATKAIEKLFEKFPEKYDYITDLVHKDTVTLVVINMFPAKTKENQSNIIDSILTALGSFATAETLLKDCLEDTPDFISYAQPNDNFITLEDIDSTHKLVLKAMDVLRKLYKFEEKAYDGLKD